MVTNQVSFKQAVGELKIPWTTQECEQISARKEFKQILRAEKYKYHSEVANQPGRNKNAALGLLLVSIENLAMKGEDEKVVAAIEKLAKLEGWIGGDSNVNIFAGLTARDIAEAKKRLQTQIDPPEPARPTEEVLPN